MIPHLEIGSRSAQVHREATCNPIFLFRSKILTLQLMPDGLATDSDSIWVDELRDVPRDVLRMVEKHQDELSPNHLIGLVGGDDVPYVTEQWKIERVFLSRKEATDWAAARHYNYPDGWDVYCIPCEGQLAALLKEVCP